MFASFNLLWIQFEFVEAFAAFLPLGLLCAYLASQRRSWWWASFARARARRVCARELAPVRG